MRGKDATATSRSKKVALTRSHPGVLISVTHTTAASTTVEIRLITTDFVPWRLRKARRSSSTALTDAAGASRLAGALVIGPG